MQRNAVETMIGAVVLVVAIGFAGYAYQNSDAKPVSGYSVNAKFSNVDGLSLGSDVRVGGIKVGIVRDMSLDPKTYQAVLKLELRDDVKLPTDSSASVSSEGLLGPKYVSLEPGADEEMIEENGLIQYTQASVSLESMIGKFIHSGGGVDSGSDDKAAASTSASAATPAATE